MRSKFFELCIVCLLMLFAAQAAYAQVYTADKVDGNSTSVYVAGNQSFYPIEYYNKETKQYEGVMPEIFRTLSERTGIDFTYLHGTEVTQSQLAQNSQAEIVSGYITDSGEAYAKDNVTVFSYLYRGKMVNVGWAFTEAADEELIEVLKTEAGRITENEINGYLVSSSYSRPQDKTWLVFTSVLCCVLFAVIIVFSLFELINTKKKMKENEMTDAETGIGNLLYFEHCFSNMISKLSRSLYYIVYIIIDSNYLQVYHGESIFADAVKYTSGVLNSFAKHNETAARITENGFVFAFQSTNDDDAKRLIDEITYKLNLYIQTDDNNMKPFFYAAAYKMNQTDHNCEILLFNLRRNCSKLIGKEKQIVFCSPHMMNSAVEEKQLLESIADGFKNQEFKLYLQFIVDNKTKQIVSAEALSRWDNPHLGILPPGEYIKTMESSGVITNLDYYMFELSCRQLHKWKDTEHGTITISCNFTRITLSEEDFVEKIKEIASKYVFEKSKLIIEITEDAIEKNRDNAMDNVRRCKEMGFKIALDDLGSGYTSLINLCEYPIDIVKIDRDILLKTDRTKGKDLFVGIIALAHSLNLKVVCEGVETEEQNALVSGSDCDLIQGWYYSQVMPEREGEAFVKQYFVSLLNK